MRQMKTRGYANHSPELTVHVYGFSSGGKRDELAKEIRETIRRFRRKQNENTIEIKIAPD